MCETAKMVHSRKFVSAKVYILKYTPPLHKMIFEELAYSIYTKLVLPCFRPKIWVRAPSPHWN